MLSGFSTMLTRGLAWTGGWSPPLSTHHLPTILRSLSFEPCQYPDTQVYFGGRHARPCISLSRFGWRWRFVDDLSDQLTSLRVLCDGYRLREAMPALNRLTNLRELDIDLGETCPSPLWFINQNREPLVRRPGAEEFKQSIQAVSSLQRVGVHAASQSYHIRLQDPGCIEVCMTLNMVANEPIWAPCMRTRWMRLYGPAVKPCGVLPWYLCLSQPPRLLCVAGISPCTLFTAFWPYVPGRLHGDRLRGGGRDPDPLGGQQ